MALSRLFDTPGLTERIVNRNLHKSGVYMRTGYGRPCPFAYDRILDVLWEIRKLRGVDNLPGDLLRKASAILKCLNNGLANRAAVEVLQTSSSRNKSSSETWLVKLMS